MAKEYESEFSVCTRLHPDILDILYEHRRYITKIFREVIGLHEINHVSVTLTNPSNEIVIFSSTPNIEYNLINQNLWKYDLIISSKKNKINKLIWWNEATTSPYSQRISEIKEQENKFALGMSLVRRIDNFYITYSFATKRKDINQKSYYISNINGLYDIGDYCYKSIRDIYSFYCKPYTPPKTIDFTVSTLHIKHKPYLQLVVNNCS